MTIDVLVPFDTEATTLERTTGPADGPRGSSTTVTCVALLDNGKPRAGQLLAALGQALCDEGVVQEFFVHRKAGGQVPIEVRERDDVLSRADLVVAGVGDCGGCTAGTVADAQRCLDVGVPSFVVVTTQFETLARTAARESAGDDPTVLTVAHPIWTRDATWFEATGKDLAAKIADRVG